MKTKRIVIIGGFVLLLLGVLFIARNPYLIKLGWQELRATTTRLHGTSSTPLPHPTLATEYHYGTGTLETIDVYPQVSTTNAPIIVMVHGGAWYIGDKANTNVWQNKLNYWGPKGFMFISVNYPMMNDGYKPDAQAREIARALSYIQANATTWGGDASKMVVMGHSAGAHLVSLVSVKRTSYPDLKPWSGTILLDSAAYDLTAMMQDHPASFYKDAFGPTPAYWSANSPLEQLTKKVEPLFLVCSSNRADSDCNQAEVFKNNAISLGGTATLRAEALSHEDINVTLGLPGAYSEAVDGFIESVTK
jgi:acetyl esterase/lipase